MKLTVTWEIEYMMMILKNTIAMKLSKSHNVLKKVITSGHFDKKTELSSDVGLPVQLHPVGQTHIHVKLPGVLVQTSKGPQPPLITAHSSISTSSDNKTS